MFEIASWKKDLMMKTVWSPEKIWINLQNIQDEFKEIFIAKFSLPKHHKKYV